MLLPLQVSSLAKYWLDSSGVRHTAPILVKNNGYGVSTIILQTPKILAAVRAHFGCATAEVRPARLVPVCC